MSRSLPWRRTCSDTVHWRQLQALQATVYVLQQTGPTAFLLKEGDCKKKLRVSIGDPSSCTCSTFVKEKEVCVHILWVILKLFRIPPENPITWQGALVEREIQQLVKSREQHTARAPPDTTDTTGNKVVSDAAPTVPPRPIVQGDVCPICQDDMLSTQNLCYCRYSCGHSVHSRCMKVWADHQLTQGTVIHCPMCRADFGTLKQVMTDHLKQTAFRPNVHPGTHCKHCSVSPIEGKVYTCTICDEYLLCMKCFASNTHPHHPFQFREKPSQRWRPAERSSVVPSAVIDQLQSRDITDGDYDTLLALDNPQGGQGGLSSKELAGLKSVMLKTGHSLLADDNYCTLCLSSYTISQHVISLPCHHHFHHLCAVNFLQHQHDYCPTCNARVEVVVPVRKKPGVVRYNVKEEEEVIPSVDFSLSGAAFAANTAGPSGLRTIESYSPTTRAKPRNRTKNTLPSYTSPIVQPISQPVAASAVLPVHGENFNIAFENSKSSTAGGKKKKHRMISRGLVENEFQPDLAEVFIGKKCDEKAVVGSRGKWEKAVSRVTKNNKCNKVRDLAGMIETVTVSGKRISSS